MTEDKLNHLRVNPQVFQAILLSRIEKQLKNVNAKLGVLEARGIPFEATNLLQRKTISAGKSDVVYEYDVRPYLAYIWYVGCHWYANTYYLWEIDGVLKEKVQRIIGSSVAPVSEPVRLEKPLIASRKIRWVAYNNDTVDHVFEVFHDGILYSAETKLGGARY